MQRYRDVEYRDWEQTIETEQEEEEGEDTTTSIHQGHISLLQRKA